MVYRSCNPQDCKLLALSSDNLASELRVQGLGCPYLEPHTPEISTLTKRQVCLIEAAPIPVQAGSPAYRTNAPQELCLPIHQRDQLWGRLGSATIPTATPAVTSVWWR